MNSQRTVRRTLLNIGIVVVTVAFIAAALLTASRVLAQNPYPDGPVTASSTASPPSPGDGPTEGKVSLIPAGNGGDGLPAGTGPANPFMAVPGPDMPAIPQAVFSYYWLVGTAFNNRTTSTTFDYAFNGCVYETGGTDDRFMAPLLIPNGSVIKYLRLYYNDTSASNDITAWITRYQPGVSSQDLTSVKSTGSSGYGTTLSPEITHTVDLSSWAYTLIISPGAYGISSSFCGVRVAYYAPTFGAVALPVVVKHSP